jgi:hypothetical protein
MLSPTHRRYGYAVLALLFLSGLAHFVLHRWFSAEGEFGPHPHPLEPWMLKLHGAAAMFALVLLGSLWRGHVRNSWRHRRNRGAGGIFLACVLLLAGSGYGLYYLGGDAARDWCRQLHIVVGLLAAPAFAAHVLRGLSERRRLHGF